MKPARPALGRAWVAAWCSVLVLGASASTASANAGADTPALSNRCGWFDNPSPGNATLTDRDGEWTIGLQGGHQARGTWPRFKADQWVRTGTGSAGYGCTCLKVKALTESQEVTQIVSARALPLSTCRNDRALKGKEPENPLK